MTLSQILQESDTYDNLCLSIAKMADKGLGTEVGMKLVELKNLRSQDRQKIVEAFRAKVEEMFPEDTTDMSTYGWVKTDLLEFITCGIPENAQRTGDEGRIEPDTNDSSNFPAEGRDIEDLTYF